MCQLLSTRSTLQVEEASSFGSELLFFADVPNDYPLSGVRFQSLNTPRSKLSTVHNPKSRMFLHGRSKPGRRTAIGYQDETNRCTVGEESSSLNSRSSSQWRCGEPPRTIPKITGEKIESSFCSSSGGQVPRSFGVLTGQKTPGPGDRGPVRDCSNFWSRESGRFVRYGGAERAPR